MSKGWCATTPKAIRMINEWIRWHEVQLERMVTKEWEHPENKALWEEWMEFHSREIKQLKSWLSV